MDRRVTVAFVNLALLQSQTYGTFHSVFTRPNGCTLLRRVYLICLAEEHLRRTVEESHSE
jgi:hypothetical protein